jgi:SAM-dependent methyltransferase
MKACLECAAQIEGDTWDCTHCGWHAVNRRGYVDLAAEGGHDGFLTESFALLPELEERSFWFRNRNALIGWALDAYAPAAASFLELGCGTGYVLQGLAQRRPEMQLVGGEPHAEGLDVAASRVPSAELLLLDGRRLPYREEFDAAGAFDVLEHIDDDALVVNQLRECLRPGGILFVTVPQHPWLWSPIDEFSQHRRRYRRRQLEHTLIRADLEIMLSTSFVTLALPLVALSRVIERHRSAEIDPGREFRLPALTDRLLEATVRVERAAIRLGARLPCGSSLLVVARRPYARHSGPFNPQKAPTPAT